MTSSVESLVRIKQDNDIGRHWKIWSLCDPQSNMPDAELNGKAVSLKQSDHISDEILNVNREIGDAFDRELSNIKRSRTDAISPYCGLVKLGQHLHILTEFLPLHLATKLVRNTRPEELHEILKIVRRLEQQYRIGLLSRIVRHETYHPHMLKAFEERERAIVVNQSEKMHVAFSLLFQSVKGKLIALDLEMSRYSGLKCMTEISGEY